MLDEPMNGASFLAYVEYFFVPAFYKGVVIVMYNLPSHKVADVREAIERAARHFAICFPTAPYLNVIEQSLRKAALRKVTARTIAALIKGIA